MPRQLSEVEKAQIVSRIEEGWSIRAVAQLYNRNKKTILKIKQRWEQEDSLKRKIGSGRRKLTNPEQDAAFLGYLRNNPFATVRDAVLIQHFLPPNRPPAGDCMRKSIQLFEEYKTGLDKCLILSKFAKHLKQSRHYCHRQWSIT
ncbi:unnamed protein product [Acanthoscelides obtectus]|uniref:Uncharacterized protein n=1 Tax=Acanthoscelides obtectus TaxID=200917 RepID=A0A9P0MGZ4_ACAOB|nr:unnamed protein product [Acanthoscelides obtectus]CAK1656455.1 hypothetical protein AOBTE_LOCUS19717 [Acanthoscelides obtectus]